MTSLKVEPDPVWVWPLRCCRRLERRPIPLELAPLVLLAQAASPALPLSWTVAAWALPLLMGAVIYPLVWRHWGGLTPLTESDLARLSPAVSGSPLLRGVPLLRWNTASRICNAAVLGCVPGFRYLMISDRALETLKERSVTAIVAHELGHVRNWHVAIRLLIVLASGAAAMVAIQAVTALPISGGWANLLTALVPVLMSLYLWLALRRVAPALEHQADAYALRLLVGEQTSLEVRERLAEDLIQAIGELSVMAGLPLERRTWLHPSWQDRRQFLLAAARSGPAEGRLRRWIGLQLMLHLLLLVSAGWGIMALG